MRQVDWKQYREPRFILAASTASLVLAAVVAGVQTGMNRTGAWSEVYSNGSLVGMIPDTAATVGQVKRLAAAYSVPLSVVPVHTVVPANYNWSTVMQLPEQAYAVSLNGQPVVYTSTPENANAVIQTVKASLTPNNLSTDATTHFNGHVTVRKTIVGVTNVRSVDAAVSYILHPPVAGRLAARGVNPLDKVVTASDSTSPKAQQSTNAGIQQTASSNPSTKPLLTVTANEVVSKKVQVPYKVKKIKDNHMAAGTVKVTTKGKSGTSQETLKLTFQNSHLASRDILSQHLLSQPKEQVELVGTNAGIASGPWIWPSPYHDVTSPYGPRILFGQYNFHPGIDIGCPIGTPIYATNNGVVQDAGWNSGGYGNWVVINNGNGIQSVFGHMSRVAVHPGERVAKGDTIGYSGATGFVTGPHLHYEIRLYGQHINPSPYM